MLLDESLLSAIRADSEWRAAEVAKGGVHRWNEENLGTAWGIANATSGLATVAVGAGQQMVKGLAQQGQAQVQPTETQISSANINSLPQNVQNSFHAYKKAGWRGNVSGQSPGTGAGGRYYNTTEPPLPKTDSSGNPITYREFDVNNKVPSAKRDAQRFVVGSDGSVYFTDSHYGDIPSPTGLPPFVQTN